MTEKNEALRLADALGNLEATGHCSDSVSLTDRSEAIADAAAAELRRLAGVEDEWMALSQDQGKAERQIDRLTTQRDALLGAIKPMIDLAEFWINHHQNRHMSEQEFKVWLALGHESNAMLNARAAIKKAEGQ
jgi:hypothetical protein